MEAQTSNYIDWLPYIKPLPDTFKKKFAIKNLSWAIEIGNLQSTDKSTKLGCTLNHGTSNRLLAYGKNHYPSSIKVPIDGCDRPKKYAYIEHAERDLIFSILKDRLYADIDLYKNYNLYCPWYSCTDCARAIIMTKITQNIIGHKIFFDLTPDRWKDSIKTSIQMFEDSGINCYCIDDKLGLSTTFNDKVLLV